MKKALSLVELLVAMAIIAVLTGLAVYGIGELNKNSRDTQRMSALGQMVEELSDYKKEALNYPLTNQVSITTSFSIGGTTLFQLTGATVGASSTTQTGTKYEYSNEGTGQFGLCAVMESGSIANVGQVELDCL